MHGFMEAKECIEQSLATTQRKLQDEQKKTRDEDQGQPIIEDEKTLDQDQDKDKDEEEPKSMMEKLMLLLS